MSVRLSDQVRIPETGEVTTCAALLDSGRAFVEQCDHFHSPRSSRGTVTAHFVTLVDPLRDDGVSSGWRIGQKAYESRAAKGQDKDTVLAQIELERQEREKSMEEYLKQKEQLLHPDDSCLLPVSGVGVGSFYEAIKVKFRLLLTDNLGNELYEYYGLDTGIIKYELFQVVLIDGKPLQIWLL